MKKFALTPMTVNLIAALYTFLPATESIGVKHLSMITPVLLSFIGAALLVVSVGLAARFTFLNNIGNERLPDGADDLIGVDRFIAWAPVESDARIIRVHCRQCVSAGEDVAVFILPILGRDSNEGVIQSG